MNTSPRTFQERLERIGRDYIKELPSKMSRIEKAWEGLKERWDDDNFKTFYGLIHSIAGGGATFGFPELSSIAMEVDDILNSIKEDVAIPDMETLTKISSRVNMLKQAIAELQKSKSGKGVPSAPQWRDMKLIYLVEDDKNISETISLQIRQFGYTVRTFQGTNEVRDAVKETLPAVIIMDVMFPEGDLGGIETVVEIQKESEMPIPVIFISLRDDISARLEAVRAGGIAYFHKPVDAVKLIDKLDILTAKKGFEPYRILIVDDEPELADSYAAILKGAGMDARVVTNPMEVISNLVELNPDLILMDVNMPDCSGVELAKVIRQMDAYVSIPIVFLSVESRINRQLLAMKQGGDDFLIKPIDQEHLISSVTIRAERMRLLRGFMMRDSLTGLLNHSSTKRYLDIEVARAKRQNHRLAFAMIDIDKFKAINDTYGHHTGDRVIKALSRLLEMRLRRTDIIGRYGGEEFAAILTDTDRVLAVKILDEIRNSFAKIKYKSGDFEFSATFSCGIATFPEYKDADMLNVAADRALYKAKNRGRNQVVYME